MCFAQTRDTISISSLKLLAVAATIDLLSSSPRTPYRRLQFGLRNVMFAAANDPARVAYLARGAASTAHLGTFGLESAHSLEALQEQIAMRTHLAHSDKHEPPSKVPPSASLEEQVRVLVSRVISVTDSSSNTTVPTPLEELIRLFVNRVSNGDSTTIGRRSRAEEIIFDWEVNGMRYLLMRMPTFCRTTVSLSCREQEIVRMVAQGHPNKIIADVLDISACTVSTHLRRIFAKLGVTSRAAMVACQLKTGPVGDLSALVREPHAIPSREHILGGRRHTTVGEMIADDRNVDAPNRKAVSQRSARSHGR